MAPLGSRAAPYAAAALTLLVMSGCGGSKPAASGAAAQANAAEQVTVEGVAQPVRVVTDRYGISHIHAESVEDLYVAWGFVTARERLWQMEHSRRGAQGRLSEWIGNRALRADGGAQLFELATRARRIWERESRDPASRMPLERYAAGVNAYLKLCRHGQTPWPVELQRLGREPEDWKPEDTVLLLLGQGVLLDLVLPELDEIEDLKRHGAAGLAARHRFEDRLVYRTIPTTGAAPAAAPATLHAGGVTPLGATAEIDARFVERARHTLGPWLAEATRDPDARASNVFAVGPRRTARGKPILANDPHLPLSTPGPLHVVHLTVPGEVDALGAAVPGLPAIVSGRNRACAWGITSLSADMVDLYADTLSADRKRVRWNGGWTPLRREGFTMRYRLLGVVPLPLLGQSRAYTPHGPVLVMDSKQGIAVSMRWNVPDEKVTLRRMLGLERSRDAGEVAERFRSMVTPGLNVVAADTFGSVIYQTVGAVPRRGFPNRFGLLPDDGTHEWRGTIPPDSMPAWRVPRDRYVVNANNLPGTGDAADWPRFDWAHDRALRMAQRLEGDASITLADAHSVQNDVTSRAAERFVPLLLRAVDALSDSLSPRARAAAETLRVWDHRARRDRVAPTLYRSWLGAFQRRSHLEGLPGLTAAALAGEAPEALAAPGKVGSRETPSQAAARALEAGLWEAERRLGPVLSGWQWGRAHRARFPHALAWRDSTLSAPSTPADGDNSTPCVGRSGLPYSVTFTHGPVWRHLVDLASTDSSFGNIAPGNWGDRSSPHARDHLARWANHAYVPLHLEWNRIEALKESELTLTPR